MASVWRELKRRNVVKVAVAYAIVGWLLVQIADTFFPALQLPEWTVTFVAGLVILGFPLALILSWAYELTPDGMERTKAVPISKSITEVTGRKLDFVIIGILAIAVAFFAVEQFVLVDDASTSLVGTGDRRSIAVLPLDNLSPDPENAFFADGIHGDLLTQLSKIRSLKVISRTSVLEYRDSPKNMREIGRELGVATILEGDVRRAGDTVRINVQLIDAETDEHLWAETYDRELTAENIFAIQREIATSIARELQATLTPQELARLDEVPTQSTRAYNFYLSGNEYSLRTLDQTSYELAVRQYERAVDADPQFALAHAALSRAHLRLYWLGYDRTDSRRLMAEEAMQHAFQLAPDLPEVHLAKGYYHYHGYRAYEDALTEFSIAEEGMPGHPKLLEARAYVERRLGQWEQSIADLDRAIELDPRNAYLLYSQSRTYMVLRNYIRVDQILERQLEILPDDGNAYSRRLRIPLWRDGDIDSIRSAAENPAMVMGVRQQLFGWTAALYERDYDKALSYLDDWGEAAFNEYDAYIPKAVLYGVTHQLAGNPDVAEQEFRVARVHLERVLESSPDDPRLYTVLGEVLAALGEVESAARMARQAVELVPTSSDALDGPIHRLGAVRVFAAAGYHDAAIAELATYLAGPGRWSIEGLLPDPRLDSIRDDPEFQAVVEKYRRE